MAIIINMLCNILLTNVLVLNHGLNPENVVFRGMGEKPQYLPFLLMFFENTLWYVEVRVYF